MEKLCVPVQIRFADVDMSRHVHNAVYLHWFELARVTYFRRFISFDHDWLSQGLILARNEVDYRQPVLFTDEIEVEVWCSSLGKKSIEMSYEVVRKGDRPGICAEGRSVLVCYNANDASSIEIPAHWRTALEGYM